MPFSEYIRLKTTFIHHSFLYAEKCSACYRLTVIYFCVNDSSGGFMSPIRTVLLANHRSPATLIKHFWTSFVLNGFRAIFFVRRINFVFIFIFVNLQFYSGTQICSRRIIKSMWPNSEDIFDFILKVRKTWEKLNIWELLHIPHSSYLNSML